MHTLEKTGLFAGIKVRQLLKKLLYPASVLLLLPMISCHRSNSFATLERGFAEPPDSVRIGCYWYWVNDNISKEAVVEDLKAMKRAGITRAFIGNMGKLSYPYGDWQHPCPPYGNIKFLSDEWWDVLHTALKTAAELDIEIGIFNSPGWSQAGGPWIEPSQAMRSLVASEVTVKGPVRFSERMAPPVKNSDDVHFYLDAVDGHLASKGRFADSMLALVNDFQDVKTLAFRVRNTSRWHFDVKGGFPASRAGDSAVFSLVLPQPAAVRSLTVVPGEHLYADCELQIRHNGRYRTVGKFNIDRTHRRPVQGYDARAPIAISFPEVEAQEYKLVFRNMQKNSVAEDVVLSSAPVVERYAEKILSKMSSNYSWSSYMWDASPVDTSLSVDRSQVIDISSCLDAATGVVTWDVPEGEWVIMRMGMTPTGVVNNPASPEATGLEVDKASRKHATAHFDAFTGQILKRIPAADRSTFKVVVMDSYETGGQNFTDDFLTAFQRRYGYDPAPFLPVYKGYPVGSPELSDRFLWDMRRLLADRLSSEFVGGLRDASHANGLITWLENYGHWGFPGEFLQYGSLSDEIAGEFWSDGNTPEKAAAVSCAHIYGKNKVWAESFTNSGNNYGRHPALLKRFADRAFSEGVNASLLHVYIQQLADNSYPGLEIWANTEFNRKNTWFSHLDLFTLYLRRCNYMLQQGLDVADAAYYIGEDVPKMSGVMQPALPLGYHADFINSEVIIRDLTVKDGRLVLPHGTSYRVLVLPPQETMRPEVLRKIVMLAKEGAVIVGSPPKRSPSLENYPLADSEVETLAAELAAYIHAGASLEDVFAGLKLSPDFFTDHAVPVLYNHRKLDDGDIYFVTNQSARNISFTSRFRVSGLKSELWNPVNGSVVRISDYETVDGVTAVNLTLDACESAFVVFRRHSDAEVGQFSQKNSAETDNHPSLQGVAQTIPVTSPWTVLFNSDSIHRGPSEPVIFNELTDWSKNADPRIRYYSGTAVYKNAFTLSHQQISTSSHYFLEFGNVAVMAKVRINGQEAGGVWTPPYRLEITPFLRDGENGIEIEAVNSWVNRIIGDLRLPENERRVRSQANTWNPNSHLQESGLIGNVNIITYK
jgi:hypothetical protein